MANPVFIGSNCIARIGNQFFLIAEIEAKVPGVEIDPLFAIRATAEQARRLIRSGVMRCKIQNTIPRATRGKKVELKGVLFANGQIFSVFDVENSTDKAVLVRINVAQAQKLISKGTRIIKVIRRPFIND
ncbi:hypothetical protein ACFQI7_35020 [Paenibacillus allorhizosphaerae]|uniref:Uncharacterized protein n=1 Tax=Paenibacillus allorhizosphaerae TaxID=2849866 RepID=A0ABM8VTJ8_9BACL|nr:hypothetical protein [Paenibacillus allorhizosphaerae]CAG7657664.1 hypothetical protein PAECIP111802_06811 [Paenibacillus allorhizosphaerae]